MILKLEMTLELANKVLGALGRMPAADIADIFLAFKQTGEAAVKAAEAEAAKPSAPVEGQPQE